MLQFIVVTIMVLAAIANIARIYTSLLYEIIPTFGFCKL